MFFHKRPLIFVFRDTYSIYFKRLAYRLDSATRNPSNNLLLSTFVLWHIAPYYNQSFSLPFLFCVQAAYQLSIINYQFVVRSLYSVERIEGKQEFLPQRERRDTELHRERPLRRARSGRIAVAIVVDRTSFLCFYYIKRKDTVLLLRQRRDEALPCPGLFIVQCSMKRGSGGIPQPSSFPLCVLCDSVVKNPIPKFLHNLGYRVRSMIIGH